MEDKDKITVVFDSLMDFSEAVGSTLVRLVFDFVRASIGLPDYLHEMYEIDLTNLFAILLFADEIIDIEVSPLKLISNSFKDIVNVKMIGKDEFKSLLLFKKDTT